MDNNQACIVTPWCFSDAEYVIEISHHTVYNDLKFVILTKELS